MTHLPQPLFRQFLIVDGRPNDFRPIVSQARQANVAFHFAANGNDALELSQRTHCQAWLVNLQLADMTGLELLSVVRGRRRAPSILLVGDNYSASDELTVRASGATAYLCKPVDGSWLSQLIATRSDHAIRAGPVAAPG